MCRTCTKSKQQSLYNKQEAAQGHAAMKIKKVFYTWWVDSTQMKVMEMMYHLKKSRDHAVLCASTLQVLVIFIVFWIPIKTPVQQSKHCILWSKYRTSPIPLQANLLPFIACDLQAPWWMCHRSQHGAGLDNFAFLYDSMNNCAAKVMSSTFV